MCVQTVAVAQVAGVHLMEHVVLLTVAKNVVDAKIQLNHIWIKMVIVLRV